MEQFNFRAAIAVVSIPVPATGALPALILHLVPIQGSARAIFTGALALIVATPLSAPSAPPVTLLAALFDLTPTEGRIAGGILEGKAVSRLATELGLSTETAAPRAPIGSVGERAHGGPAGGRRRPPRRG